MLNRESRGGWQRSLPLPDLSRKIKGSLLAGYLITAPDVTYVASECLYRKVKADKEQVLTFKPLSAQLEL